MKHRHAGHSRHQPVNRDGHAIGLDLGATCIRAAVLTVNTSGRGPSVTAHGMASIALPPGAVVNGAVVEPGLVAKALKELWKLNDFNCSKVILGVANPQVVVRTLQIPNLSAQQRAKALPFQAREIIALPLEEVVLDYAQIGEPDPKSGLLSGLLIATPRKPVLSAVDAVEKAGLTVARVDLSSFGALRASGNQHLNVQAVIDLGAHLTSIIIHNHGVPQLVRTLAHGGQELTNVLVDRLDLNPEEAEQVKREIGLIGDRELVTSALESALRPLLSEIRSSINYFRSSSDGAQLDGISLTGGAANLPGLPELISRQNGVLAEMVDPMQHIGNRHLGTPAAEAGASAVSVGLAIGAAA